MVAFASPEWIEQLDAAVRTVEASGPPLRVRYVFLADEVEPPASRPAAGGYDLVFGDGIRAEPSTPAGAPPAAVTISQPWALARDVAAGRMAAQQALLDGSIRVAGQVAELLAWRDALDALDGATAELRARTDWPLEA